jgi:Cu+-exporting ATPase
MSTLASATPTLDFKLPIEGMTCASCVLRVEKALATLPGVESAAVNLATEQATVRARDGVAGNALVSAVTAAVRRAGYDVPTHRVELQVDGMTCASCVARVEKALLKVPGVTTASVNLATEKASVGALGSVSFATLAAAIDKAGYAASPVVDAAAPKPARRLPEWWPVAVPRLLTLPLVLPMLLQLFGIHWMLTAGCSWRWPRRCSSGSARASTAPAGRRCGRQPATWTCWWRWAPARPTG